MPRIKAHQDTPYPRKHRIQRLNIQGHNTQESKIPKAKETRYPETQQTKTHHTPKPGVQWADTIPKPYQNRHHTQRRAEPSTVAHEGDNKTRVCPTALQPCWHEGCHTALTHSTH